MNQQKERDVQGKLKLSSFFLVLLIGIGNAYAVPFESQKMAYAGPGRHALDSAKKIISSGGNIVDATVATTLSLAVTHPYYASIGGGGFALIHYKGKTYALDFREVAPAKAHERYFYEKPDGASAKGGAAVGVPGVIAGLWEMHKRFGKKPWKELFTDAILLAEGFPVSGEWHSNTKSEISRFNDGSKKAFLTNEEVPTPGSILRQPNLNRALKIIRAQGPKGFYMGAVASDLVDTVNKEGGDLSFEDLKAYKAIWREPISVQYLNHEIQMMPPPSSSAVVMGAALKLFEQKDLASVKQGSIGDFHLIIEALKRAFRGRFLLGDPAFVKNPIKNLLGEEYLKKQANSIRKNKSSTVKMATIEEFPESKETTHFSLMDNEGHAVALTITLNGRYGSGVTTKRFGIALNNEMDDFTTKIGEPNQFGLVQGVENKVEPGKRPLSSMSPTLVLKDKKVVMSLGSPGGPRIISSVAQVIHRVLGNQMNMDQAIQFPRVHHQVLPNTVFIDPGRTTGDTIDRLTKLGHTVVEQPVAKVYGVRINAKGFLEAAHDSRGEGASGGL